MSCALDIKSNGELSEGMWNLAIQPLKYQIFTNTMPMTTKLGRVVTYLEGLLSI